jgi:hypothetical protein
MMPRYGDRCRATDTNRMYSILFDMHNRAFGLIWQPLIGPRLRTAPVPLAYSSIAFVNTRGIAVIAAVVIFAPGMKDVPSASGSG